MKTLNDLPLTDEESNIVTREVSMAMFVGLLIGTMFGGIVGIYVATFVL